MVVFLVVIAAACRLSRNAAITSRAVWLLLISEFQYVWSFKGLWTPNPPLLSHYTFSNLIILQPCIHCYWSRNNVVWYMLNFTHSLPFTDIASSYLALLFVLLKHLGEQSKRKFTIYVQRPLSHRAIPDLEKENEMQRERERGWYWQKRIRQIEYAFKSRRKLLFWTAGNWKKKSPHNPPWLLDFCPGYSPVCEGSFSLWYHLLLPFQHVTEPFSQVSGRHFVTKQETQRCLHTGKWHKSKKKSVFNPRKRKMLSVETQWSKTVKLKLHQWSCRRACVQLPAVEAKQKKSIHYQLTFSG